MKRFDQEAWAGHVLCSKSILCLCFTYLSSQLLVKNGLRQVMSTSNMVRITDRCYICDIL